MKATLFITALIVTACEPVGNGLIHFFAIIALWASFVGLCAGVSNRTNIYKEQK
jgi:hypothetical protein